DRPAEPKRSDCRLGPAPSGRPGTSGSDRELFHLCHAAVEVWPVTPARLPVSLVVCHSGEVVTLGFGLRARVRRMGVGGLLSGERSEPVELRLTRPGLPRRDAFPLEHCMTIVIHRRVDAVDATAPGIRTFRRVRLRQAAEILPPGLGQPPKL